MFQMFSWGKKTADRRLDPDQWFFLVCTRARAGSNHVRVQRRPARAKKTLPSSLFHMQPCTRTCARVHRRREQVPRLACKVSNGKTCGLRVARCVCEKYAQNVSQPNFYRKLYITFSVD
jgi:hypothetical protein